MHFVLFLKSGYTISTILFFLHKKEYYVTRIIFISKEQIKALLTEKQIHKTKTKNTLAPMGVLAPGSAHARPSARPPIDTSGNFLAHMSGGVKLSESFSDQLSRQIREF